MRELWSREDPSFDGKYTRFAGMKFSPKPLSAQIAQLEAGLGVRLFERDRSRVVPTDAGQELLDRARQLLLDAGDLVDTARRRSDPLTRTVRIGIIPTVAPYLVPDAARGLRARYPALAVVWDRGQDRR